MCNCDHDDTLLGLIAGFERFRERYHDTPEYQCLVQDGQKPRVLLLACSDSRVDPAITLDVKPGELFVIRNVANLVPPYETNSGQHGVSAAIEYAVSVLKVDHIIVKGHAKCGGIRALVDNPEQASIDSASLIGRWMAIAKPAYERAKSRHPDADNDTLAAELEKDSILASLDNLMTFPMVRERVKSGDLKLHGWYFDITNGTLRGWNPRTRRFEELTAPIQD